MSENKTKNETTATKGWAIGGALLGGFFGFAIRSSYGMLADVGLIVGLGLVGAIFTNEIEYQWLKRRHASVTQDSVNTRIRIQEAQNTLKEAEDNITDLKERYAELLQKGADTDSSNMRQVYAVRTRMVKYKVELYRLIALKATRELVRLTVADTLYEMGDIVGDSEEFSILEDINIDADELQRQVDDIQIQFKKHIESMANILSELDKDNIETDLSETQIAELVHEGQRDIEAIKDESHIKDEIQIMNELANGRMTSDDIEDDIWISDDIEDDI